MAEEVRGCREEELGAVTALASRVFCGDGGDMGADYPRMFAPGNRRTTDRRQGHGAGGSRRGLLAGRGQFRSTRARRRHRRGRTDREYRSRGLAPLLTEDARNDARDRGASLMLISGGRGCGLLARPGAQTIPFPDMLGVIDAPRRVSALRPILSDRSATELEVATEGDAVTLCTDGESCAISTHGPLAALLFGGETDESRAIPQATGQIGPLLERLCPISSLWQGYDYV